MKNAYVRPEDVISPKSRWTLNRVVVNGDAGQPVWAIGTWNDDGTPVPVIATRWNGTKQQPLGNPFSRQKATWIIIEDRAYPNLVEFFEQFDEVTPEKAAYIRAFLNLENKNRKAA
jgi:hypothetical protein